MSRYLSVGIVVILIAACTFWFYQNSKRQQDDLYNQKMFDVVMSEKMQQLYTQAQNWEKPIQLNVHDKRLYGDYKIMSEFLLTYWTQNAETRNQYLRELKAAKWDSFLDVERLDHDRIQNYAETTRMLEQVKAAENDYQERMAEIYQTAQTKAKALVINNDMKAALLQKLNQRQDERQQYVVFNLEQQVYVKAEQMFDLLKNETWQKKQGKILFEKNKQVQQFNTLYQDVLRLNLKIDQAKQQSAHVIQQDVKAASE